jgi:2-phospho-L-lactate/phosphoenolpyruvate guanylyltransferase
MMGQVVDLIVPVKRLDRAKSRLRGAFANHEDLVLALLLDTVTAASQTPGVRRVLVVCEDDRVPAAVRPTGVECVDKRGLPGLNPALEFGASVLRADDARGVIGALQADLPALRPADLAQALAEADGRRAFCADRAGTGTTLLLSAPGRPLDPRFGAGSAAAHAASGAVPIAAPVPALRCDVDTTEDLAIACALGPGPRTSTLVCIGSVTP